MRIKEEEVSKQSRQMTDGHSRRVPTPPDPWAIQIKLEAWASAAHTARMGVTQDPWSRLRLALALGALGVRGGTGNLFSPLDVWTESGVSQDYADARFNQAPITCSCFLS